MDQRDEGCKMYKKKRGGCVDQRDEGCKMYKRK